MDKEGLFSYWKHATFKRYKDVLEVLGSLESAFAHSKITQLHRRWKPELISDFIAWKNLVDERELQTQLDTYGIQCIGYQNQHYPQPLKHLHDPPTALFVRGMLPDTHIYVSIVGTRKYTFYGKRVTEMYIRELSRYTICVVSGLAFGIDAIAHRASIEYHLPTIAVLPGSVADPDIAPQSHTALAAKILQSGGAIVSEYPPGFVPFKASFARRNRIVAALSVLTLVTEAPQKSGALITADLALDLGKDVFAVPHGVHSNQGAGCNELLAKGAYIAHTPQTIPIHLGLHTSQKYGTNNAPGSAQSAYSLNEFETQVLSHLCDTPLHVDDIASKLLTSPRILLGTLTKLELHGLVENTGGMHYVKI